MKYRREIDGLRAVAVLPVILFHGGFAGFEGGYLGVDVFFVLSGYLITSILYQEHAAGSFSIMKFYERRARRILPALILVVLACIPFAWAWLVPRELAEFSRSVLSVVAFVSNVFFWTQSNYFATAAELKPLLHTWSLGIEEQFYVAYPLVIAAIWRMNRKSLPAILLVAVVASLVLAQWVVGHRPSAAFFLLPTRAWELLAGGLVAVHLMRRSNEPPRWVGEAACVTGIALLGASVASFDPASAVPGFVAFMPIAGTALLVLYASPENLVGKVLGMRLLVGIGLISYSAYLWHQPLFAFARHALPGRPPTHLMAALAAVSLLLAWATWWLVEQPFRTRAKIGRRTLVASTLAGSVALLGFGIAGAATDGFRDWKVDPRERQLLETAAASPMRDACHYRDEARHPDTPCEYFHSPARWALLGDSHGVELAYALGVQLDPLGIGLRHYSRSGCGPEFGNDGSRGACQAWTEQAMRELMANQAISTVVVTYRLNSYLFGEHRLVYPDVPDRFTDGDRESTWAALAGIVGTLVDSGKQVVLVLQAPEIPRHVEKLVLTSGMSPEGDVAGVSRAWWDRRSRFVSGKLESLPPGVGIVDPADLFCEHAVCLAASDGVALFFDDNHMSIAGASIVASVVLRQAREQADARASRHGDLPRNDDH